MGYQRGKNGGVSGLVDIAGSPKFTARIYRWHQHIEGNQRDRSGRGDNAWGKSLVYRSGGTLALSGKVTLSGWPMPAQWKGQTGSVVVQFHTGVTQTLSVRVLAADLSLSEAQEDTWDIALSCVILSDPSLAGFPGSQPTTDDPSASDSWTWEGLSKTIDPQGLQDGATQRIDIDGLADTDAAEVTKIGDVIAAATPPVDGLKLRPAGFQRLGNRGGIITLAWGRTNTADDVVNPQTRTTIDPSGLTSNATAAAINGTPDAPTGDAFVKIGTTTTKLNDDKTLTVDSYGLRTSHQGVEMDGTSVTNDPLDLSDDGTITKETTSATPPAIPTAPAGTVHRKTTTRQLNPGHWSHTFEYGERTTAQDVEMPGTETHVDPKSIEGRGQKTSVYTTTDGMPEDPTPPSGLQIVESSTQELNQTKSAAQWLFGVLNSQQKIEYPRTKSTIDNRDLETGSFAASVFATDSPPSAPAAPSGTKLVDYADVPVTPTKSVRVWRFGKNDTRDEVEQRGTFTEADPSGLASRAAVAKLDATPTLPGGYVSRGVRTQYLTPDHYLATIEGGLRTTEQDQTYPHTKTTVDAHGIESSHVEAAVWDTGSEPSAPAAPSGLKLDTYVDVPLVPDKSLRVWTYRPTDSKDRAEFPHDWTSIDPQGLASRASAAMLNDDPALPDGFVERATREIKLDDVNTVNVIEGGLTSTQDDIELPGTFTETDPAGLGGSGRKTSVFDTSDGAPDDPTPPAGLKITASAVKALNGDKSQKTWEFGPVTSQDKIEYGESRTDDDPADLEDAGTIALVQDSATPSAPTTPTGLKLARTDSQQLNDGKWLHRFRYARLNTADRHLVDNATAEYSAMEIGSYKYAQIVDSVDAANLVAAAWHNTFRSNADYEGVGVRRLNLQKTLVIARMRQPAIIVHAQGGGGSRRMVSLRKNGDDIEAFVNQVLDRGSSWKYIQLAQQSLWHGQIRFSITKRISASTLPMHTDLTGTTNNAAFLGLPAGMVTFLGTGARTNIADGTPRVAEVTFNFLYDSLGMIDTSSVPTDWYLSDSATVDSGTRGWTALDDLDLSAALLPGADYSGFLS